VPSVKQELLIVADEGREAEVITRLARVGYDNALGYLKGGFDAWTAANKDIDQIHSVSAEELAEINKKEKVNTIDARKASEYSSEHVVDAMNAPLDFINDSMTKIDKDKKYYVHCASGYRSMVFIRF
jgi:hydroxyacylglutathione hydrolase